MTSPQVIDRSRPYQALVLHLRTGHLSVHTDTGDPTVYVTHPGLSWWSAIGGAGRPTPALGDHLWWHLTSAGSRHLTQTETAALIDRATPLAARLVEHLEPVPGLPGAQDWSPTSATAGHNLHLLCQYRTEDPPACPARYRSTSQVLAERASAPWGNQELTDLTEDELEELAARMAGSLTADQPRATRVVGTRATVHALHQDQLAGRTRVQARQWFLHQGADLLQPLGQARSRAQIHAVIRTARARAQSQGLALVHPVQAANEVVTGDDLSYRIST